MWVAGTGWGHYVTRMPRVSKLVGLVKPWAVRRRTWSRLVPLDASVGSSVCVVPGQDLVCPCDEGVDGDAPMFVKSWYSGSSPVS